MNVAQRIEHENRLVIFTVTGRLTDESLLAMADAMENDSAISDDFGWLIDLRSSDGFAVTAHGLRTVATRRLVSNPASRRAVVVPLGLGEGMGQMYQLLSGDGAPRVFANFDDAHRWAQTGEDR